MNSRLVEHILSIAVVTIVVWVAVTMYGSSRVAAHEKQFGEAQKFLDSPVSDLRTPFRSALFNDLLELYHPAQKQRTSAIAAAVSQFRARSGSLAARRDTAQAQGLDRTRILAILLMYVKFLIVFWIVLALTWYGALTLGAWRFVRRRAHSEVMPHGVAQPKRRPALVRGLAKIGGIAAQFVLFSPAFVIAYSIKTQVNTDTMLFLIVLVVVSNGLLVTYANKFYHILETESRRGYVLTAQVKNLSALYGGAQGISWRSLCAVRKRFDGHVFGHIYRNAAMQYLGTVKEQAAFLITGLVITEMALNIHGYLSYELLRQLLYRNVAVVAFIALLIFYAVKMAEILVDFLAAMRIRHYENPTQPALKKGSVA